MSCPVTGEFPLQHPPAIATEPVGAFVEILQAVEVRVAGHARDVLVIVEGANPPLWPI